MVRKKNTGTQIPMATTAPRGRSDPAPPIASVVGKTSGGYSVKTSDDETVNGVVVVGLVMQPTFSVFMTGALISTSHL